MLSWSVYGNDLMQHIHVNYKHNLLESFVTEAAWCRLLANGGTALHHETRWTNGGLVQRFGASVWAPQPYLGGPAASQQ